MPRDDGLIEAGPAHDLLRVQFAIAQYLEDAQPLLVTERAVHLRHTARRGIFGAFAGEVGFTRVVQTVQWRQIRYRTLSE